MAEQRIVSERQPDGVTKVALLEGDRDVSRLWIIPFEIRVGAAIVRMDGIGGVGTEEECRNRGYSRRVLDAAIRGMTEGDAAVTMLYGIPDFYPKWGYATVGPDHLIRLRMRGSSAMPAGWGVRPLAEGDLPECRRLYQEATALSVGAAVRAEGHRADAALAKTVGNLGECRVVVAPDGALRGYAWKASHHWYVQNMDRDRPETFTIGEVLADGAVAADAALAVCRAWCAESSEGRAEAYRTVTLGQPPVGPVAAAARLQHADLLEEYAPAGGSMVRVLDTYRLLSSLAPELARRVAAAGLRGSHTLALRCEVGEAAVRVAEGDVTVLDGAPAGALVVEVPQPTLGRLAFGGFTPDDLLDRLPAPLPSEARALLEALFPHRCPHMHFPDRY
jgi:hypothetical protein